MQNTASWLQLEKKKQHSRKYSSKLLKCSYHSFLFHRSHLAAQYNRNDFLKGQRVSKPLTLLSVKKQYDDKKQKVVLTNYVAYERSVISDSASDRPCSFEQNDQKIQDPIWIRLIPLLILQAGAEIPLKKSGTHSSSSS